MPFCRITGGSRALPKPNYFPLLPPISPADARRFCRITGKAIGLPGHHYIPVLVGLGVGREHCHITHKSEGGNEHHQFLGLQSRRHTVRPDYRYVFPVLDEESDLLVLLDSKAPAGAAQGVDEARKYVYTVDERRTSLVFPSRLEAAVRDGDVRDVMLARDADHLLLTLRKGKSVSLDVRDYAIVEDELWEGEGPGEVAYQRDEEDRKRRQKREAGLADRKRIFEAKEDLAAQEERRRHSAKVMKVKMQAERAAEKAEKAARKKAKQSGPRKWDRFEVEEASTDAHMYLASGELKELAKPLSGTFDAETFVKEAPLRGENTITILPTPVDVPSVVVDLETSSPGIVQQPALLEEVGGFPTVHAVAPFTPLTAEPCPELQAAVQLVDPGALPRQAEVKSVLMEEGADGKLLNQLPRIEEIPDLVNMLDKGEAVNVGGKVHALRLDIAAAQGAQAQRLVVGQSVETPSGRVFVPGQTVETANGPVFMPGLTVHTPDGPLLIPGQAVEAPGTPGQQVFVAGQSLHTRDGHKFVQGQMLYAADGEGRFAPGQTVLTPEGPRFVPGQVVNDGADFVVGQTVNTPNGPKFVPGQTLTTPSGEAIFLPGQSVEVQHADGEKEWEFVPGQSARADNGELRFIPGQTIATPDGPKFVAGQTVVDEAGAAPQFVPGVSVHDNKTGALKFVPGATLETADGLKFIEGQVIKTEKGVKFSPGTFLVGADGVTVVEFTPAISLADIVFRDGLPDPGVDNALEHREEVLGHMVQTSHGVEFFPGKANGLPSGKVIQGKLVKSASGAVQFVPGMDIDGLFVPGQLVMTELGEQFVPGQVVETKEGPKFVPGQVVETHAGPKFLPGQTVLTADGPRFVPGQIIETKAGPTFIPGQVICTEEEGSRFVPGQIVDTREGPRFVPGRVIETGDRVTFVPGQIVETADGLRFVAPDLQDTEEGGFEFSLQGFEVTPEELRLMRPHLSATSTAPTTAGQMSIDSRMLRQLSHAGMVVGKQVAAELPGVDVSSLPTLALAEQLGLEGVSAVKMGHVLEAVLKLSYGLLDERGHVRRKMSVTIERGLIAGGADVEALTQEEEALKNMLTEAIVTACITMDEQAEEEDVLRAVCNFFNSILESVRDKEGVVEALHGFVTYPGHVGLLCRETVCQLGQGLSRADLLRSLLWGGEDVLDRLGKVLEQDQLGQAFLHLAEAEPELMEVVLRRVTEAVRTAAAEGMDGLDSDQDAAEVLQRAIVAVVREASELRLQEMLDSDELALRELFVQAINLARALGMHDTASGLLQVLSDPSATRLLAGDRITLDILQRLTVMRQLAERRPKFNSALGKLVSDPETARNDPRLRELVRQSAALMVVPEDRCLPELQSSADIPTALFHNTLAMEEYLRRRGAGTKGALLIVKHGFQTVIPREAARDVLTGQIPYSLVDQKGIRHFAPMHVFSALRLSQPLANRYSMYSRRGSGASAASGLSSVPEQDAAPGAPAPPSTVPSTCLRCIHGDHRHHSTFSQPTTEVSSCSGHSHGPANGHVNGHVNGLVNGNGHINGLANGDTYGKGLVNGHANGHTNGQVNGHANGHSNGHDNGVVDDEVCPLPAAKAVLDKGAAKLAAILSKGLTNGTTADVAEGPVDGRAVGLANGLPNGHLNGHAHPV
ncbi:hypothetical protein FOCC_FOCC017913 [Frankliniella occidentalis]|uniref:Uncharacterized protein LOC127752172 n=1 Tax=Frankliniella occidentalis TaxID=133901 RepID=A0A9C6XBR0_FRAOC|nr:uncharacterized protein LOC127752172 [Frankliniella occidentalis]KAE8736632.1 hypothetical protein FOCC_FOCC017913 [Frankliniella occidentalis]